MITPNLLAIATNLDNEDPLKNSRQLFYMPIVLGKECIYFTGNSLGLQPKATQNYVIDELEDWASFGVEGHFHARKPWLPYHEIFTSILSKIVGCLPSEVVVMNQLTVNLHLLMVSFYKPTQQKFKIICEAKAFPSDQYAIESQVKFHGYSYEDAVIEVQPREGEFCVRTEDILATIQQHKNSVALVIFGGVNYYTGQVFDMQSITKAAHNAGAYCGFDLAHAVGNIALNLNNWEVDFACWCSYKYLNSGPGAVGGIYIHEKHATNTNITRFAGWWGHNKDTRFAMPKGFDAIATAEGWQLSNAPILSMAAHKAALDIFEEVGIDNIFAKQKKLTRFLWQVLQNLHIEKPNSFEIITPENEDEHGCQVSILITNNGKKVFEELSKKGIIADWREPNVIRIAPVPLYNTFNDVYTFAKTLGELL
jgi:kynureninase